jgi:hypothetical protein
MAGGSSRPGSSLRAVSIALLAIVGGWTTAGSAQESRHIAEVRSLGGQLLLALGELQNAVPVNFTVSSSATGLSQSSPTTSGAFLDLDSLSSVASAVTSGNHSTIIMSLKTSTGPVSHCSNASLNTAYFTDALSINAYYAENSYGSISLSGTVVGPFVVPLEKNWTKTGVANAADAAATAAGVNLSQYSRKVYVLPKEADPEPIQSAWGGDADWSGSRIWIRDYWCSSRWLAAHEFGHTLGLNHASTTSSSDPPPYPAPAGVDPGFANEYGDFSSTMGRWVDPSGNPSTWNNMPHYNAPGKIAAGWLPGSAVQTVTAAGCFQVASVETVPGAGQIQALKIKGANGGTDYYYFSYRQAIGFSSGLEPQYVSTTSVTRWSGVAGSRTYLLANLADGQTFTDASGLRVTQTSHDASRAYITVSLTVDVTSPTNCAGTIRFTNAKFNRAENIGNAAIQVERTGGDDGAVSVSFGTTSGSAVAGHDYTTASGTLDWADGEDGTKTFDVTVANDSNDESNETVNLHLSDPTGGAVLGNPSNATMTIVDDDGAALTGTVGFTNTSFSVAEALPHATVSVSRSGGSQGAASVDYDTADGAAKAGQDYTAVRGTLNWANGDAANKSFQIPILDDIDSEANEAFSVALSQPAGATLGSPANATLTILDNESVPPCTDGDFEVCLLGRFLARIHWVRPDNAGEGEGRVTKLTDSAASFEFFEAGNVEVVLKMKDACALPTGNPLRNFWPFVAGLTNVRVELTIIDTESGAMRRFFNALGQPFFTPAADSPDGKANPPGAIQATTETLGAFATCDV